MEQAYDLAFLHEWGVQQEREARAEEQHLLRQVNELVREADVVVVRLGGRRVAWARALWRLRC